MRIVTATDCRSMDVALEDVGRQISQIEAHLAPNNVQGLKHQVDTLRSQMQVRMSVHFPGLRHERILLADRAAAPASCAVPRRATVGCVVCRRQVSAVTGCC